MSEPIVLTWLPTNGSNMTDPVTFLERKLAQVEAVVEIESWKVDLLREQADSDDVPLYSLDDDGYHPLVGDPLTVIKLAEATRAILELHSPDCPTIKALAKGWGWTDE